MKIFLYILIILLAATSCKKSRYARKLEKEINDTKWEFTHATDAHGNDITAQVLADSAICECFEFYGPDDDPVTKNGFVSKCHNTIYTEYTVFWLVIDWVKLERQDKRKGIDTPYTDRWADFSFAAAVTNTESRSAFFYLRDCDLDYNTDHLVNRIYKRKQNGFTSDTILEYRYYKKIY